jgi:hypothetical protein
MATRLPLFTEGEINFDELIQHILEEAHHHQVMDRTEASDALHDLKDFLLHEHQRTIKVAPYSDNTQQEVLDILIATKNALCKIYPLWAAGEPVGEQARQSLKEITQLTSQMRIKTRAFCDVVENSFHGEGDLIEAAHDSIEQAITNMNKAMNGGRMTGLLMQSAINQLRIAANYLAEDMYAPDQSDALTSVLAHIYSN